MSLPCHLLRPCSTLHSLFTQSVPSLHSPILCILFTVSFSTRTRSGNLHSLTHSSASSCVSQAKSAQRGRVGILHALAHFPPHSVRALRLPLSHCRYKNAQGLGGDENAEITAEEKRLREIEESKFLGGDVEHTHLVKGLDYALLQKVNRLTLSL